MNPDQKEVSILTRDLENSTDPFPILLKLLSIVDSENRTLSESAKSALLAHFESLRKSAPPDAIGRVIKALQVETKENTPAAEFLSVSYKAYELIVDTAWKKTIRSITGTFTIDGTIAQCPKCKSTNVMEGPNSMYEFTDMMCNDCGERRLMDDYQLEEWYPL